ncbi:dihydroorotate dehydrogenase [Desulforudis sp. 1088]|uniref:dihydroorotate dehydrogenase n=1 Tax=unclassified Candidatus Desulforudis TaxID=2635950 RepID=UPI003CE4BC39
MKPDLAVEIAGIRMQNPVTTASGTFGYGFEYAKYVDLSRLGALTVKTITFDPRDGNPPPRIAETPSGMLNAVGLENPGVDRFIADVLPGLEELGIPVVVSIAGNTVEEYAALAERLDPAGGISAVEVNISCPNVKAGGIAFGTVPEMAAEVVKAVKAGFSRPVIAKLTPNVTDIRSIALAVAGAGADAISLINTLLGMSIDWRSRKPLLANVFGGLSGPAVKPVALRCVWQVFEAVSLPIIGMGGISSGADALEFILAGARAVAVGTANIVNPTAVTGVLDELEALLVQQGVRNVNELVGAAHR